MITAKDIETVLGRPVQQSSLEDRKLRSPGTRYRHYSPKALVYLLSPEVSENALNTLMQRLAPCSTRVGYLGSRKPPDGDFAIQQVPVGNMAASLYMGLRHMDDLGVSALVVDGMSGEGIGLSVMDRLTKAASHILENDDHVQQIIEAL